MDAIAHFHMCLDINNNRLRGFNYFNLQLVSPLDISTTEDLNGFR